MTSHIDVTEEYILNTLHRLSLGFIFIFLRTIMKAKAQLLSFYIGINNSYFSADFGWKVIRALP